VSWKVYSIPYYTDASLTDTSVKQGLTFTEENKVLKAVRIWLVFYNNPTFTSLNCKIYSSNLLLLHTSTNTQSKADLISLDYGVKETYFEFNNPTMVKNELYYFVLNATGYTGASETKHIGWRNTYPDEYYPTSPALTKLDLYKFPLAIYPICARFDTP